MHMPNRLAYEKSPYLLQHADNPVNWLPWGEEAFAKARAEQKPIFLSIGYSTCHWCHVMAHETFENGELAELLNRDFVPIKVDREERPDVDRVYMAYVQMATGHGGWPLSAWLTPELKPFFGGTYFPPEDRQGRHGFGTVLRALAHAWKNDRDQLVAEGNRVIEQLQRHFVNNVSAGAVDDGAGLAESAGEAFLNAFQYYHESFDAGEGGFGGAPKFPRASNLDLLFRLSGRAGAGSPKGREALGMAEVTLQKMAQGGIRDHVGGGFHRYSVDDEWFVPHFEKMLYDQAQIVVNYLDGFQATGREVYAWVARDTLDYLLRDMKAPSGGFYSAEDADSLVAHGAHERVEGAFYLWAKSELDAVLTRAESALICGHFDVTEAGNIGPDRDPHNEFSGKNLLRQRQSLAVSAGKCGLEVEAANGLLIAALERLRLVRSKRPRPHLDDKIITAWNGLAISALAKAAQVLGESGAPYAAAAVRAAEFIERELYDEKRGVLFRCYREGRGVNEGFAEDYAFLIQGLIDLYETTFELRWLRWALRLQTTMDALFWDEAAGGYFNSAAGDASILLRLKESYDGAEPAPSSVAAMNLLRLAPVSGDERGFSKRARRTMAAFQAHWGAVPQGLPRMICALDRVVTPPAQVVLAGELSSPDFRKLAAVLYERPSAEWVAFAIVDEVSQRWFAERAPWLAGVKRVDARATAYVCDHAVCRPPVTDAGALRDLL